MSYQGNDTFHEEIYLLKTSDPVEGGPEGISNRQAKELADRTKHLKDNKAEKAGSATQVFSVAVATADAHAARKKQLDDGLATKAAKNGSTSETFSVAVATADAHAARKKQLDDGLATKAAKNGSSSEAFSVNTATSNAHAVRKSQFDSAIAALQSDIDGKIASGSNTDGRWIRFDDGTQITFQEVTETVDIATSQGSVYVSGGTGGTSIISFPNSYTATPQISFSCESTVNIWFGRVLSPGASSTGYTLFAPSSQSAISVTSYIITVGRWT